MLINGTGWQALPASYANEANPAGLALGASNPQAAPATPAMFPAGTFNVSAPLPQVNNPGTPHP